MTGNRPFIKYGIIFYGCLIFATISSCSLSKKIANQADSILFKDTIISTGHIGISIYEPATNKYWYNYDAEKYFVPASNAKLFTMYAAMKYLGDSLVGLRYQQTDSGLVIYPTGDPTFLDEDFTKQSIFDFLKTRRKIIYCSQLFTDNLGKGWAWDDYMDPYMVQRSEFPIYGNLIRVYNKGGILNSIPKTIHIDIPKGIEKFKGNMEFSFFRFWDSNNLSSSIVSPHSTKNVYEIPLVANLYEVPEFLADTLNQKIDFITNRILNSIGNKIYFLV